MDNFSIIKLFVFYKRPTSKLFYFMSECGESSRGQPC